MGNWKHGGIFGFDKPSKDVSFCTDKRGVVHALTRNGKELRHYMRGSRNPFPWESQGRTIPGSFVGSGHISVFRDGNLQLIWPRSDGDNDHWWVNPLDFDDPSGDDEGDNGNNDDDDDNGDDNGDDPDPIDPPDKRLSIEGTKILYGGEPIKLCGVSRWEALWREYGEHKWHNWGEYSLEWYEQQLINSGINYVRHGGIMDSSLLYEHCKRMKDAGIIVEVSVYRVAETEGVLVELDRMGELADLGNVFFDVCNEFIGTNEGEVNTVFNIATQLRDNGCLVSGGAWSGDGQVLADEFLEIFDVDIVTHHRDWTSQSFGDTLSYMKPVVWNEYFAMREQLPIEEIQRRMDMAFDVGINGVQYYGFRFSGLPGLTNIDPWQSDEFNDEMLTYAGKQ